MELPKNEFENRQIERTLEADLEPDQLYQSVNPIGEGFRSQLIINSRENSEFTVETFRMIYFEIASQLSKNIVEITADQYSQILKVINSTITEKVLPSPQNKLGI